MQSRLKKLTCNKYKVQPKVMLCPAMAYFTRASNGIFHTRAQQQLRWATVATIYMGRKERGLLSPFRGDRGAGSPSNTMRHGPRPIFVPSGIFIHPALWLQQTWAENWGGASPLFGGELGPRLTQCRLGGGLPPCQVPS